MSITNEPNIRTSFENIYESKVWELQESLHAKASRPSSTKAVHDAYVDAINDIRAAAGIYAPYFCACKKS